jgi:hypothetical protein
MVVSHPCEKFVFDALPTQPIGLCAHGKRVPDRSDRIHRDTARQSANDFARDSSGARLKRLHALGSEERIDCRPKRGVLRLVQGVGHHAMGGYS